jgi:3'(2'), 5'-bisphosphate nucleotidase
MAKNNKIFKKYGINPDTLIKEVIKTSRSAGGIIMSYYNAAANDKNAIGQQVKSDNSPVTKADLDSSAFIEKTLNKTTPGIAVISEENDIEVPSNNPYWAVDPLDGTKLFINRTGGFAVNIALMIKDKPVLGVVFCPALNILYYSYKNSDAFKQEGKKTPSKIRTKPALNQKGSLTALFDQIHANPEIYQTQRKALKTSGLHLPKSPIIVRTLPSNLEVAEGLKDIHIKVGKDPALIKSSGHVWDNAADFLILENAGGSILQITDGKKLQFTTGRDKMPAYIAFGDKSLGKMVLQK